MTHLENVSPEELREVLAEIEGKAPTERVMAAINWKEESDATQKEIATRYGYSQGWLSQWLQRLERLEEEPFEEVVYDEPRSGRPSELSDHEYDQFVAALHEPPEAVGIDAPAWSVPLARHYLDEEFEVDYCDRHVRRLLSEAGLTWKTARPKFDKADDRAQEAWQEGFQKGGRSGRRLHNPDDRSDVASVVDADSGVVSRGHAPVTPGDGRVGQHQTAGCCLRRR